MGFDTKRKARLDWLAAYLKTATEDSEGVERYKVIYKYEYLHGVGEAKAAADVAMIMNLEDYELKDGRIIKKTNKEKQ